MWEWLGTIKGETWGAFAGGLVVFVIKVVGPAIAKRVTDRFQRKVRELDALTTKETEDALESQRGQLELELGLAQHDLVRMSQQLAAMVRERDAWKRRAIALAAEQGLLKPGGNDARTNHQRPNSAGAAPRPAAPVGRPARGVDDVPTIPPRKPHP
jgi:hypothetical protein